MDVPISQDLSYVSYFFLRKKSDIQDSICYKTQLYQIEKCRATKEPYEVSGPEANSGALSPF
jgi:hypothetical protein